MINFIFDFVPGGDVACRIMSMIDLEVILLQEVALSRDPFCRKPNADMGIDHLEYRSFLGDLNKNDISWFL